MAKQKIFASIILFIFFLGLSTTKPVFAGYFTGVDNCSPRNIAVDTSVSTPPFTEYQDSFTEGDITQIKFTVIHLEPGKSYHFRYAQSSAPDPFPNFTNIPNSSKTADQFGRMEVVFTPDQFPKLFTENNLGSTDQKFIRIEPDTWFNLGNGCNLWTYTVRSNDTGAGCDSITWTHGSKPVNTGCVEACSPSSQNSCEALNINITGINELGEPYSGPLFIKLSKTGTDHKALTTASNGSATASTNIPDPGNYQIIVYKGAPGGTQGPYFCQTADHTLKVVQGVCSEKEIASIGDPKNQVIQDFNLCLNTVAGPIGEVVNTESYLKCKACADSDGIWTAIGCVNFHPQAMIRGILRTALGLGGGFSLLLMLYGAFVISTSAGNPERVQQGKERFTAAIIGLLIIIFSVVILNIIGVEILRLPGL